jgi:hypothetical protein
MKSHKSSNLVNWEVKEKEKKEEEERDRDYFKSHNPSMYCHLKAQRDF